MLDLIYIAGTALFFVLMAAYAKACDALGHREEHGPGSET